MSMTGWRGCNTLTNEERKQLYEDKRGPENETVLRKQIKGMEAKKKWLGYFKEVEALKAQGAWPALKLQIVKPKQIPEKKTNVVQLRRVVR